MTEKPEALRLADELEDEHYPWPRFPAADELRRLAAVEAQRDALLEALQALYDEQESPPLIRHQAAWEAAMQKARAIIAKAEEEHMSKHTPGPWSSNHLTSAPLKKWSLKVKKGRRVIAEVPYQDYTTWTNARLIAAAPLLLEACRTIVQAFDALPSGDSARMARLQINAARAAIAKAEEA